mgnify:CR=1 FL=1
MFSSERGNNGNSAPLSGILREKGVTAMSSLGY